MVMAGAIRPLFDGFSVVSINIVFDMWSTGKISNTGSEDIRVFRKDTALPLTLVGHKITLGKAFR